mgnify:CR=1 FL=1
MQPIQSEKSLNQLLKTLKQKNYSDKYLASKSLQELAAKNLTKKKCQILQNEFPYYSELNRLNLIKFLVNQGVGPDSPNSENKNLVQLSLNEAFSLIDKAVKKNILHKNNGANKKSRINKLS